MDFNDIKKIQTGDYNLSKISNVNGEIIWRKKYKYLDLGEITYKRPSYRWDLTKEFTFVPFDCDGKQTDAFHYEDRVDIITTFDTTQNILLSRINDEKAVPEYWSSLLQTTNLPQDGGEAEEFNYRVYAPGVTYSAYLTGDQTKYEKYVGNADDDHFCIDKPPRYSGINNLMLDEGVNNFKVSNASVVFNPAQQTIPGAPCIMIAVNPDTNTSTTSNIIRVYNRGIAFGCYIKCNNKWSINYFKEGDNFKDWVADISSDFIILNTASSYMTVSLTGAEMYYNAAAYIDNYVDEVFSIKKGGKVMQSSTFYAPYKTVHSAAHFIDAESNRWKTIWARDLSFTNGLWYSVNMNGTTISGETVVKETSGGVSRYTLKPYSVRKTADSVVYFYTQWDSNAHDTQIVVIKMKDDGSYELYVSNTLPYNNNKYNYINIQGKNYYKQSGGKPDWDGSPTADTYIKIKGLIKSDTPIELDDAGFVTTSTTFHYTQNGKIYTDFGLNTVRMYNSQCRLIHIDIPPMEKYHSLRLHYAWRVSANNKDQFVEFSKLDMPLFPSSLKDQKVSTIFGIGGFGAEVVEKYETFPEHVNITEGTAISGAVEYIIPNDGKHHYINIKISNVTETDDSSYRYQAYPFIITKIELSYDFIFDTLSYNEEEKRYRISIRNNTASKATLKFKALYYRDGKTYFLSKDLTKKNYTLAANALTSIPLSTPQSEKAEGKIFILFTINNTLHALYR